MCLVAGWLGLASAVGELAGMILGVLLIALTLYLMLQLYNAYQLHQWLISDRVEPAYGVGVWQEIYDELYRLKQRNRRRKKRLGRIVSEFQASTAALPDAAVVLDNQRDIVWFNDAAVRLFGLRPQADRGQRVTNLIRDPDFRAFLASEPTDGTASVEITAPVDADLVLAIQLIPYGNGQRLLIARDVSQRRRAEAARRDFVANASHELRTPLTVVRGYLEMLDSEAADSEAFRDWQSPISQMRAESARMDRMIDDLLELARLDSETDNKAPDWIDVASVIQRVTQQQPSDGATIATTEVDESLLLHGDERRFESIVSNLVTNAQRHTPANGLISLTWSYIGDHAELVVADTGEGIAPEHIPRLTERFYRADTGRDSARGGTGLGLAIVKHALKCHDADLVVHSTPGQGSRFICRFPNNRCELAEPDPGEQSTIANDGSRRNVASG